MYLFLLVVDILLALGITGLVLLQRSEGGMGGLSGQSVNSFLTARQAGNALSKLTKYFFIAFVCTSLALVVLAKKSTQSEAVSLVPVAQEQPEG